MMRRILVLLTVALVMAAMAAPSAEAARPAYCYTTTLGTTMCWTAHSGQTDPQKVCREQQARDPFAASKCRATPSFQP
jgi:hypothetical protein